MKELGLKGAPTLAELKKSFRSLALIHHPDRNPDNPSSAHQFRIITEAYNFLIENYQAIPQPAAPPSQGEVIEDVADIFDDIFGFTREGRVSGIRPKDFVKCPDCFGSGTREKKPVAICTHCFGSGRIKTPSGEKICPKCGGRGRQVKDRCFACDGFGRIRKAPFLFLVETWDLLCKKVRKFFS